MTVQVTVKCGECARTGVTSAALTQGAVPGEMLLRTDTMPIPADWKSTMVSRGTSELFCPICAREAL